MASFLKASLVAGYTKTADPIYIEKHCRQWHRTGDGFLKSRKHRGAVVGEEGKEGKGELNMKKYIKPRLRCLGLLRLVTKFSF
jgi:hypothetical protein